MFEHAAEYRRIDVSAGQWKHDAFPFELRNQAREAGGKRRSRRALHDGLFQFQQTQQSQRDVTFFYANRGVHQLSSEGERIFSDLGHGEAISQARFHVDGDGMGGLEGGTITRGIIGLDSDNSYEGFIVLAASATPAISPPPPMGMIASRSGTCARISIPSVPCPAIIAGSS